MTATHHFTLRRKTTPARPRGFVPPYITPATARRADSDTCSTPSANIIASSPLSRPSASGAGLTGILQKPRHGRNGDAGDLGGRASVRRVRFSDPVAVDADTGVPVPPSPPSGRDWKALRARWRAYWVWGSTGDGDGDGEWEDEEEVNEYDDGVDEEEDDSDDDDNNDGEIKDAAGRKGGIDLPRRETAATVDLDAGDALQITLGAVLEHGFGERGC
ncbi:hypothetical protein F4861DRAFT_535212 [Xylaria intraflava]|nr:hypothetical protein F4861DRAFT_535212 [Xylaria intraflava]